LEITREAAILTNFRLFPPLAKTVKVANRKGASGDDAIHCPTELTRRPIQWDYGALQRDMATSQAPITE
jgi:hypothetical protein